MTDPFEEYIAELVKEVQTSNPILVGVSFGGSGIEKVTS